MKEKLSIRSQFLTKLLLTLIVTFLLLIGLIKPSKYLGYIISTPFIFLFGQFYLTTIIFIIFLLIDKLFSKTPIKIRSNIIAGIIVLYVGVVMIMCFDIKGNNGNYLSNLFKNYLDMFNSCNKSNVFEITFKSNLNGGFLGYSIFSLFASFISKRFAIFIASLIILLGICILIYSVKKEIKFYNPIEEKIESNKKKENDNIEKYNFDYEVDQTKEDIDPFNLKNKISLEEGSIEENQIDPFNNFDQLKDNTKETIENTSSNSNNTYKPFNIFEDNILDDKELITEKLKKSTSPIGTIYNPFNDIDNIEKEVENSSLNNNDTFSKFNIPIENNKEDLPEINDKTTTNTLDDIDKGNVVAYDSINDIFDDEENDNNDKQTPTSFYEDESLNFDDSSDYQDLIDQDQYKEDLNSIRETTTLETRNSDQKENEIFVINSIQYNLPSISLLNNPILNDSTQNRIIAERNAIILDEKLESLGIEGHVNSYVIAPSFTRFQIEVAKHVKINAIPNVSKDLMMALSAPKINVLAPIPSTCYVGVDVPNAIRSSVGFKECYIELPYEKKDNKLLVGLGKDINGECVSISLDQCPHLLVAGTTGSGKSVCLNTIIMSILMRAKPSEVELLLIDPKKVEFKPYEFIPHLICPVVTEVKHATVALQKVCEEMDKRYALLNKYSKRDIQHYNRYMEETGGVKMPYLVVIVDELADLMLQAKNEVEESIRRLSGLARGAGIHLVLATQRPSVDVITGVIKSNISSRIAFAVASNNDSRVILDESGAEELLGKGDMILRLAGSLSSFRVQGCFIDEDEINKVANYLKQVSTQNFHPEFLDLNPIIPTQRQFDELTGDNISRDDEIYSKVLDLCTKITAISNTLLKTKLCIGYSVAARMLERLENEGLIGPSDGNKPRTVFTDLVIDYVRNKENK